MKKVICCVVLSFICVSVLFSQDSLYVRANLNKLASKEFWGRGYTKEGMHIAADYLAKEFKNIGLEPMIAGYKQPFTFNINTFPGKMDVSVNGTKLVPGKDFLVYGTSKGFHGTADVEKVDSNQYEHYPDLLLVTEDKWAWEASTELYNYTIIELNKKTFTQVPHEVTADIDNEFIKDYKAYNICGCVKGTKYPDSTLFITAHYDHLGGMGVNTYFPGANDNAAGVATLLSLAKYYKEHPSPYTICFICFTGEEAGLIGSKYFTENPLVSLQKIKFLINLDLVGTGEDGITVVNGSVYQKDFDLLTKLNDQHHYFSKVNIRGKAPNSDHYFFTEKNVPAFYIYTMGGIAAYHDIYDKPETLPLTKYSDLFRLIVDFYHSPDL